MMATVRTIPLEQMLPGMVLGDDVTSGGSILLRRGTVIGVVHLDSLRRREVSEIVVETPCELSVAEIQERSEVLRERVADLFRKADSGATMQALLRAVLEFRLEKLE